ncbi:hypothetical protein PM082_022730 [Marasmius tenuissimus]|nr:hypothetical protein PM082_022730 [Marasmius tenuissimus]
MISKLQLRKLTGRSQKCNIGYMRSFWSGLQRNVLRLMGFQVEKVAGSSGSVNSTASQEASEVTVDEIMRVNFHSPSAIDIVIDEIMGVYFSSMCIEPSEEAAGNLPTLTEE